MAKNFVTVIGAGLAGSECALQLAHRGIHVKLVEKRDQVMTPAHKTGHFAELVCSNSFGSNSEGSAPQQLKWEAEKMGSFILRAAHIAAVGAGQALAVDRDQFANTISNWIRQHPLIEVISEDVKELISLPRPCVIATGPLTSEALADDLRQHFGSEFLYFFDAIAPVIEADSINTEVAWLADRYDKGEPDYYNCPMNKEEYFKFIEALLGAEKVTPKHFDETPFFEGCMPIEVMAQRGQHTLRFGPMKPVGLVNPKTGREAYAIVQLRKENLEGTCYNMVGFQTRMTYPEQKRVFRMIPGLENAEFLKLGSLHRNLYINTPTSLSPQMSSLKDPDLFFAGQITGVEGYFESAVSGLWVAQSLAAKLQGKIWVPPHRETAMGSLHFAITDSLRAKHFQPTNINFGLFPALTDAVKDKSQRKNLQIQKARSHFLGAKHQKSALPFADAAQRM